LTGLGALKYLNIPMFNSLRRLTTLITMFGEYYILGKKESFQVQISVWFMFIGAGVAGIWDFDYSFIGYFLVLLNCIFTAVFLLSISKFGKQGLNSFGLMYYNNIQSLPIVLLICYFNGDLDFKTGFFNYEYLNQWDFWIYFLFQSGLAFLLNYAIFLCTNINSALATSVTGQIKNIATTAGGYVAFGDVTYNLMNVIGLTVGVISSTWYSYLKYKESEVAKKSTILPSVNSTNGSDSMKKAAALAGPLLINESSATKET
jgi:solute carrier family 35 protein